MVRAVTTKAGAPFNGGCRSPSVQPTQWKAPNGFLGCYLALKLDAAGTSDRQTISVRSQHSGFRYERAVGAMAPRERLEIRRNRQHRFIESTRRVGPAPRPVDLPPEAGSRSPFCIAPLRVASGRSPGATLGARGRRARNWQVRHLHYDPHAPCPSFGKPGHTRPETATHCATVVPN